MLRSKVVITNLGIGIFVQEIQRQCFFNMHDCVYSLQVIKKKKVADVGKSLSLENIGTEHWFDTFTIVQQL